MNKYQNQGPGVTQMISLVNYANLYRKCYIFDVLLNYLEHLSENDKADGKKRKEERGSGSSKADKSTIQAKHATRNFRKALEFGIGSQMFQAIEFRSLNVEELDCGDNDRDYLAEYRMCWRKFRFSKYSRNHRDELIPMVETISG